MARAAVEPSAKRAKVDEAKEEEDPLVRRKEEVVRLLERARKGKDNARAKEELLTLCARLEAKNEKLFRRLPPELWQKILDENVQQNDRIALAMTCKFFRDTTKGRSRKLETNLGNRVLALQMGGRMPSHSLGWFRWVCDKFELLPGYQLPLMRVMGAMYEGQLLNYAAFQGSVEILRWLIEENGWELDRETGEWAGLGGSVEVLEYLTGLGYEFKENACAGAAFGGRLEALKFLRGLDPPCPWDVWTCARAAQGGHLDILKWLRSQDPPCPWDEITLGAAAEEGHLDVLKFLRSQDPPCPWSTFTCSYMARGGHLEVLKWLRAQNPPCPWSRRNCRREASRYKQQHVLEWIDQQEDERDMETDSDGEYSDRSYESYGDDYF
ncbi:putative ankyrin repeat protein [Chloropicon roscoffensis]|uniref:Ankyrin repeat protein n=1 Tax=Chloropicon roscoffensis TaxID=1461544 RepID=A0AAX4PH76_9CHLO